MNGKLFAGQRGFAEDIAHDMIMSY